MIQKKIIEKFSSSYILLLEIIGLILFVVAIGIYENGIVADMIYGLLAATFIILLTYTYTKNNNFTIIDNIELEYRPFLSFNFKTQIQNISQIDRSSTFIFPHWGSRLHFHFTNERDKKTFYAVKEAMFADKTIKAFLTRLKELNPDIKLHPQYQDLIDGKIDLKNVYFKSLKITPWKDGEKV